jgi:hypothetical protein
MMNDERIKGLVKRYLEDGNKGHSGLQSMILALVANEPKETRDDISKRAEQFLNDAVRRGLKRFR